jgi:hypothetical protein
MGDLENERLRFTTFVTLGAEEDLPPPPDPTTVVVEYEEWHAADGDRPAVVGEPWSFLALAEDVEQQVATPPADRTRLVQVAGPRFAFHARPLVAGASQFMDSSGCTAYEACGFRFALEDPPGGGWVSGVATFRLDTYQVADDAVFDAARQTLHVVEVLLVRRSRVVIPGQPPTSIPGIVLGAESVPATEPVPLDHRIEAATFHVTVRLPPLTDRG